MANKLEKLKIASIELKDFMGIYYANFSLKQNGVTQITGKNGAGKSTLVKFIEWMIKGPTSVKGPQKKSVVRTGADKVQGTLHLEGELGKFKVVRTLTEGGTADCEVINEATGKMVLVKVAWLKSLVTEFSFDPLKFAQMDSAEQVEELKKLNIVDLDFAALAEADETDTKARVAAGQQRDQVEADLRTINTDELVDLPADKVDEQAIFAKLSKAQETDLARQELGAAAARIGFEKTEVRGRAERIEQDIEVLEEQLKQAREKRKQLKTQESEIEKRHKAAEEAYQKAPVSDVNAIGAELQKAQRNNRLIDVRAKWERWTAALEEKRSAWRAADERIEARRKLRTEAIANAKLPVKGLSFEDFGPKNPRTQVYYKAPNGSRLPLGNYGEGEQIRISTLLGIHMHPTLQAMCIQHGEALDEDNLKVIEDLAVEHNFQIIMARVETSGTVGIVMANGAIKKTNEEAKVK